MKRLLLVFIAAVLYCGVAIAESETTVSGQIIQVTGTSVYYLVPYTVPSAYVGIQTHYVVVPYPIEYVWLLDKNGTLHKYLTTSFLGLCPGKATIYFEPLSTSKISTRDFINRFISWGKIDTPGNMSVLEAEGLISTPVFYNPVRSGK